jgi:hypothetical protein
MNTASIPTQSFDYYVPEDPMDALQCDSCQ